MCRKFFVLYTLTPSTPSGEELQQDGFRNLEASFKGRVRFPGDQAAQTSTNFQTEGTDLGKLVTVLVGRSFRKTPVENRLGGVQPELPTICGNQVNLVKTGTSDTKVLVEASA